MKKTCTYIVDQIDEVAQAFADDVGRTSVITLTGALGAGKTTFVGALLRHWGVRSPVVSPTFTYVNIYKLADGRTAYHFDLYRLRSMQEFEAAGFFEYLGHPNSVSLIEWPEIILPAIALAICRVELKASVNEFERTIIYQIENEQVGINELL